VYSPHQGKIGYVRAKAQGSHSSSPVLFFGSDFPSSVTEMYPFIKEQADEDS
jgi:hypothetical protein